MCSMAIQKKTGVLLINLGTPKAATLPAVYRYLVEFLTDPRVIDLPWFQRHLLVRGAIIPKRLFSSTKAYRSIWREEGSPLLVYGYRLKNLLQGRLGALFDVELAMRYQSPSIEEKIEGFQKKGLDELIILPLFPQYASATTGSIFGKVSEALAKHPRIPKIRFIDQFASDEGVIKAFCAVAAPFSPLTYDHVLMSFHGLPEKQLKQADRGGCCLKKQRCCESKSSENRFCYSAQCYVTANGIAENLDLPANRYSVSFQSRLGKDPWTRPYTSEELVALAKRGVERVLVLCPAFVSDCLETLFEIGVEYEELFRHAGGKALHLVPALNDHPVFVDALEKMIRREINF